MILYWCTRLYVCMKNENLWQEVKNIRIESLNIYALCKDRKDKINEVYSGINCLRLRTKNSVNDFSLISFIIINYLK